MERKKKKEEEKPDFRAEYARGRPAIDKKEEEVRQERTRQGSAGRGLPPLVMKDWHSLHDACWSEDGGNTQSVRDLPATGEGGTGALPLLFFRIQ